MAARVLTTTAPAMSPVGLTRPPEAGATAPVSKEAAVAPAGFALAEGAWTIEFRRSGITATRQPGAGTPLELAEAAGLSLDFGCRSASCQTCWSRLLEGTVAYVQEPDTPPPAGVALICSAVPAATSQTRP